jgi:uncharacterized membrane protein (DUF2068 family)
VAVLEASKGGAILLLGFGVLGLVHRNVEAIAAQFVGRLHLNPARHLPHIFLEAASHVTDARLWALAWLAFCYAVLRFVEAYGLWLERRWAEWFAVVSGGIYLPIELLELTRGITWVKLTTLAINLVIVMYMAHALSRPRPPADAGSAAAVR